EVAQEGRGVSEDHAGMGEMGALRDALGGLEGDLGLPLERHERKVGMVLAVVHHEGALAAADLHLDAPGQAGLPEELREVDRPRRRGIRRAQPGQSGVVLQDLQVMIAVEVPAGDEGAFEFVGRKAGGQRHGGGKVVGPQWLKAWVPTYVGSPRGLLRCFAVHSSACGYRPMAFGVRAAGGRPGDGRRASTCRPRPKRRASTPACRWRGSGWAGYQRQARPAMYRSTPVFRSEEHTSEL